MPQYLVTGAAGFIGSKVCEFLLANGNSVIGIDSLNDYYDVRLKDYRLAQLLGGKARPLGNNPKTSVYVRPSGEDLYSWQKLGGSKLVSGEFSFYQLDIENYLELEALFQTYTFDAVFNLAARAGVRYSMENPHVYMTTNSHGTLNILECQRKYRVMKHVLASTSSLYAGCPMPFTEDQPVNTPLSPYAASKKAAEMMAYCYHKLYGIDISILRYFTVFGPAGRPDMAPLRFTKCIAEGTSITLYGDGKQARDFTYIDDVALGTIAAVKRLGYQIINIGGGKNPIALLSLIKLIEAALGKSAQIDERPFQAIDMKATWADIAKAEELLGWKPLVNIESGVRRTVDWYLSNKNWIKALVM